jgi:hypothetical protein
VTYGVSGPVIGVLMGITPPCLRSARCARRCIVQGMGTTEKRDALRYDLRRWGEVQRGQSEHRDPMVLASLEAGVLKEEIHHLTGLGRTTIDRIERGARDG